MYTCEANDIFIRSAHIGAVLYRRHECSNARELAKQSAILSYTLVYLYTIASRASSKRERKRETEDSIPLLNARCAPEAPSPVVISNRFRLSAVVMFASPYDLITGNNRQIEVAKIECCCCCCCCTEIPRMGERERKEEKR